MSVKVKAYAKINLMLDIISTRKDGYHDLFMIMQSINLYDTVTISETKSKKITITCNIDDIPLDEKNIAYKAADAFFKANKIKNKGINIDIVKRIPHQAGLAGGSADGAALPRRNAEKVSSGKTVYPCILSFQPADCTAVEESDES